MRQLFCLSVCPSVTLVHYLHTSQRIIKLYVDTYTYTYQAAPTFMLFSHQTPWQNFRGVLNTGGV